ncbi:beta-N-acetylhexosaminidase [Paenibacillus sp. GCM10027626]|uniref:beta-N-acetylhexosaminidase n=1 Tax=Paenibacillus sp. GCM10027626 TaxID=3273411 RepID=UPI00362833E6
MRVYYGRLFIVILLIAVVITGCGKENKVNSYDHHQGQQENDNKLPPVRKEKDKNERTAEGDAGLSELKKIVAGMTLEEKIGQMIIAGVAGAEPDEQAKKMIEEQHVGGVIFYKYNLTSPNEVTAYVNQLKAWNANNVAPLLVSVDQEGGKVSRLPGMEKLPEASAIGKAGKKEYAAEAGALLAEECRLMGINMDFAPVLDINSNPKNPVIGTRSFGTTADTVAAMGLEVMKAIRGGKVIPVVKHFPGHGDTAVDSHLELPVVKKELAQLQAFEWLPFKEAIKEGAEAVMIAHILFPKVDKHYPASLSRTIITDQLRGTLGFKGVVITDDLTMGAIVQNYGIGEAAVRSIKAGGDIVLVAHEYENVDLVLEALLKTVKDGELTEQRIDESVVRILQMKQNYKLTDEAVSAPVVSQLNERIRQFNKRFK